MENFTRVIKAKAYQITFEDAHKEEARKGVPVSTHGNTLRYDQGQFSVLIHTHDRGVHAFEGDIVVTEEETGKIFVMSEEAFSEIYTHAPADEDEEEEDEEVTAPTTGPDDQLHGLTASQKPPPPPLTPTPPVDPLPNVPSAPVAEPTPAPLAPASENGTMSGQGELSLPPETSGN